MSDNKSTTIEKHVLTNEEKIRLSKTRVDESQVEKEARNIISKHQNAIKELASR